MAGRPLRPATRRRLGGPLPRQLADGPRAPPQAVTSLNKTFGPKFSMKNVGASALDDEVTFDRNLQRGRGLMRY